MEILLVSSTSKLLGVASRLVEEGHTVTVWGGTPGNGYTKEAKHPYNAVKECRYILTDGPIDLRLWDWAKTFNRPVVGAHPLGDMLNTDCYREYQIAEKLGLAMPKTEVITDISDMYTKVLEWNSARTVIRYDRESITCDHQRWLAWAVHKLPFNKRILLQRPVWGEEISLTGWFDGLRWARPFILKTPSEDKIRVSSSLALFPRRWTERVIQPWEMFLKNLEYRGPVTVKAYASKEHIEFLELRIGFDFPSLYGFLEGLKEPVGDFLHRIAFSTCEELPVTNDFMSCAVVGTTLKEAEGAPIIGLDEGNRKHLFLGNIKVADGEVLLGKQKDWVYTVTARGRSLQESFGRLYFTNERVQIPQPNIMTNVKPQHEQWFNKVRDLGYL